MAKHIFFIVAASSLTILGTVFGSRCMMLEYYLRCKDYHEKRSLKKTKGLDYAQTYFNGIKVEKKEPTTSVTWQSQL